MRKLFFVSAALVLLLGCSESAPPASSSPTQGIQTSLRVKVLTDGSVFANDQPVTLDQLAEQFDTLSKAGGTVWYYRETPGNEPHPNAMEIMRLIVENQLPVTLSTKSDFSDSVGPDGVPRRR